MWRPRELEQDLSACDKRLRESLLDEE
jgi:hypothetical protein